MLRRGSRVAWIVGWAVLSLACLVSLRTLPYSSSWIFGIPGHVSAPPTREGFRLGPLVWRLSTYQADPRLEPLRAFFESHCAGLSGVHAGICVSQVFASEFPMGEPRHEFVDATYDPVADLAAHQAGEPGHCVTRSGLTCAVLLASGIPCRVMQIYPERLPGGHNVSEIWDDGLGWMIVDGTFRGYLRSANFVASPEQDIGQMNPRFRSFSREPTPVIASAIYSRSGGWLSGERIYPEPWLYTRAGARQGPWPFRGAFGRVRHITWKYGLGQRMLEAGALCSALLALVVFIPEVWRRVRRRGAPRAVSRNAGVPSEV